MVLKGIVVKLATMMWMHVFWRYVVLVKALSRFLVTSTQ